MKNSLDALSDKLAKILGQLDQIEGKVGKSGGGGAGGSGVMNGSLSNVTTVAKPFSMGGTLMQMGGTALATMGGMAAAASSMMPDLAMTVARRRGFYEAGVASGGMMGHGQLESSVRLGLGKFSTSQGSDAAVAAMLTNRGMVPGSKTFSQTVTGVGQAARYLNMSNEVAAGALEGLTSGPTSAMMMRNFGVFTSNPSTGQAMSQGQIFEQLAQRFTGGRETTLEGTMESLRRGNLGSNIRNSGLDAAQQQLLSQYMIDRARGINMDLSDPDAISEAIERNKAVGVSNPMLSQYTQNSKDNELMEYATEKYISGMEKASDMLIELKDKAVKPLIDSFGELKATVDFFTGDMAGGGLLAGVTALFGGAGALGGIAGGALAKVMGGKGASTAAGGTGKNRSPGPVGASGGKKGFTLPKLKVGAPLAVLATLGGGMLGDAITGDAEQGSSQSQWGNATGRAAEWAGMGSMLGMIGGPKFMAAGALLGGLAGGISGFFSGGSEGSTTVPGPDSKNWTGRYGEKRSGGRTHKGIDVALPVGTPLKAVMDGVVSAAQGGSGARSYGLYVSIEHSGGKSTLYAHMSKIMVKVGDKVTKGQIIGLSGNTGFSTGPHLHFELRVNGKHTDPSAYVGLAYGPGGTKGNTSAMDEEGNVTGASGNVVPNNFISASWAGVSGGSSNVKDIIMSSAGGSLASLPTGAVSDIPASIGGSRSSSMMGVQLSRLLKNNSPAVGGGEESLGVAGIASGGIGANKLSTKSSKSNVTINVTVASASEAEARRFAKLVKQQLEEDSVLSSMGRK